MDSRAEPHEIAAGWKEERQAHEYIPHAFLQDKCRDCRRTKEDHAALHGGPDIAGRTVTPASSGLTSGKESAEELEQARRQVLSTRESTRALLEQAEREREEALLYKREAEALRAAAQAEAAREAERAAQLAGDVGALGVSESRAAGSQEAQQIVVTEVSEELLADDALEPQPIAPSRTATSHALQSDVDSVHLSSVLRDAERAFQLGSPVIRFQAHHPPTLSALFLRQLGAMPLTAPEAAVGAVSETMRHRPMIPSLCWSRSDARTVHPTRTLAFEEISAVVLGQQASVFKGAAAVAADERDRCCVSFITGGEVPKRSLHLQFASEKVAEQWAYGIAGMMKAYGFAPSVYESGQYFEQTTERAKDFSPTDRPTDPVLAALQLGELVTEQTDGARPAVKGDLDALARMDEPPQRVHLELTCRCLHLPSEYGTTLITLVARNERTNRLELLAQSEPIVSGSSDSACTARFPVTFMDHSAKSLRVNVYDLPPSVRTLDDSFRLGSALVRLQALADQPAGVEFLHPLVHHSPRRSERLAQSGATLVVTCVAKGPAAASVDEYQDASQRQSQSPSSSAAVTLASVREHERLMGQAAIFTRFVEGSATPHPITLFYTPGTSPSSAALPSASERFHLGHLTWAEVGGRPQTLDMRHVTDVLVGRKHRVFPPAAPDQCCFSLVTKDGPRLDLQAGSKEQRDAWVSGVIACLQMAAAAQSSQDRAANAMAGMTQAQTHGDTTSMAAHTATLAPATAMQAPAGMAAAAPTSSVSFPGRGTLTAVGAR